MNEATLLQEASASCLLDCRRCGSNALPLPFEAWGGAEARSFTSSLFVVGTLRLD